MHEKLGLVSISFRHHTPREILETMKSCGLRYIEWGSDVHAPAEKAEEVAALTKEFGIECCSYGTYFRLGTTPLTELESYIVAAKILGTKILRLWCGNKNSQDYTEEESQALFSICKEAALIAERSGVVLCMECHNNTYTNTKESAYRLMQAVGSKNFRMYWQPNQYRAKAENLEYAALLAPYTEHLHVFNWEATEKYPLREAVDQWKKYVACFPDGRYCLLEFMPDDRLASLQEEVRALREIVNG